MDNKQMKKLFKAIYKTTIVFVLTLAIIGIYFASLLTNTILEYKIVGVVCIIILSLLIMCCLLDARKTSKILNKYSTYLLTYLTIMLSIIFEVITIVSFVVINLEITFNIVFAFATILGAELVLIFGFVIGNRLSKLYQNLTITIDSASETPNYNDELMLKKELDELNRKLEIKKVQEQIDKVRQELDEK